MSSSRVNKENLIRQFRTITNATQNDASRLLKQNGYRLEASIDAFYSDETALANATKNNSSSAAGGQSKKAAEEARERLAQLFEKYRDEDGTDITIDGAMAMCEDLGIQPDDVVMLPLSFYLKSPSLGTFQREAYAEGWRAIAGDGRCDTLEAQQALLPKLREDLKQDAPVRGERGIEGKQGLFHRTYEFTYTFARPEGQKSLPMESAIAFWDLLMPYSPTFGTASDQFTARQLNMWKTFLQEKGSGRAVSKDTWMLFLDFTGEIDAQFTTHDFDAAWPSQIDDFVEWARKQPSGEAMDES